MPIPSEITSEAISELMRGPVLGPAVQLMDGVTLLGHHPESVLAGVLYEFYNFGDGGCGGGVTGGSSLVTIAPSPDGRSHEWLEERLRQLRRERNQRIQEGYDKLYGISSIGSHRTLRWKRDELTEAFRYATLAAVAATDALTACAERWGAEYNPSRLTLMATLFLVLRLRHIDRDRWDSYAPLLGAQWFVMEQAIIDLQPAELCRIARDCGDRFSSSDDTEKIQAIRDGLRALIALACQVTVRSPRLRPDHVFRRQETRILDALIHEFEKRSRPVRYHDSHETGIVLPAIYKFFAPWS